MKLEKRVHWECIALTLFTLAEPLLGFNGTTHNVQYPLQRSRFETKQGHIHHSLLRQMVNLKVHVCPSIWSATVLVQEYF